MRTYRFARRRRATRRVVAIPARPRSPVTVETMHAWDVGLVAATAVQRLFGGFFVEHCAHRRMTTELGAGMACALWLLIEKLYALELRWPREIDFAGGTVRDSFVNPADGNRIPAATALDAYEWISDEWLAQWWYTLEQLRPAYYGLDIQSSISGDSVEITDAPTLLLWQLFSETALALGVDMGVYTSYSYHGVSDEDSLELARIRPLPADTPMIALVDALAAAIPEARELTRPALLLHYAAGATGNPLADCGPMDIELVHMDEDGGYWPYSEEWLHKLSALQAEARAVASAYSRWRARMLEVGWPALHRLAARAHRLARQIMREQPARSTTLIEALNLTPEPADVDDSDDRVAWATVATLSEVEVAA